MKSISIIKETLKNNTSNLVDQEIEQYKEGILINFYFESLLDEKIDKKLEEYVLQYITINNIDKENKKISYSFKNKGDLLDEHFDIEKAYNMFLIGHYTLKTMYNNLLTSIIIEFESIITKVIKKIITKYPEAYLLDKSITYERIIKLDDIAEVKRMIITNEVDIMMRDSLFELINKLEKKHKVIIPLDNYYAKIFSESYLRRNIIVHNDSRINKDYINGMISIGEQISEERIGKRLICSEEYIEKVIDASIYMLILFLNQITVLFKDETETCVDRIIEYGFQKIQEEKYSLAREIFRVLINNKNISQQSQIYSLINYWQTYKWDGKYDEIQKELEEFDVSAYEIIIKLAIYALREEYDDIKDILHQEFNEQWKNEELAMELEEYPVFKALRKQKFYKDIKKKYWEVFSIKSTKVKDESEDEISEVVDEDAHNYIITLDAIQNNEKKED